MLNQPRWTPAATGRLSRYYWDVDGQRPMAEFRSEFLRTISERGFIQQCTDDTALDALLADLVVADLVTA